MPWLRLWVDILDDPDLDALPEDVCWAWAKLLAIAKRHDRGGELPERKRLYTWMRRPNAKVEHWIVELTAAGLIEESEDGTLMMHGWARWQEPKDRTNAKRQADYRARHPKPPRNAVTSGNSESETDTEQSRAEQTLRNKRNAVTQPLRNDAITPPPAHDTDSDAAKRVISDAVRHWQSVDLDAEIQANELVRCFGAETAGAALEKAFRALGPRQKPWAYAVKLCREGVTIPPSSNGRPKPEAPLQFVEAPKSWKERPA